MKKIFKILIFFLTLLVIFSLYEITSIDNRYINRSTIDIDINNARNPQIKRLVRKLDLHIGSFYFSLSKKKQKEFYNQDLDKYKSLPNEIIIPATLDDLTISNNKNFNNTASWKRSHGNHSSNKFSNLRKINSKNIKDLELAWVHSFEKNGDIPGNPIYFNKKVYLSSTGKSLVALNAINGKKIWEFKTEGKAATRGLILKEEDKSKIYFCDQVNFKELYADTGDKVKEFRKKGKIKKKKKCQITPVIIDDKIIIGTFEPAVEV